MRLTNKFAMLSAESTIAIREGKIQDIPEAELELAKEWLENLENSKKEKASEKKEVKKDKKEKDIILDNVENLENKEL